jgi:hypothetical protein
MRAIVRIMAVLAVARERLNFVIVAGNEEVMNEKVVNLEWLLHVVGV